MWAGPIETSKKLFCVAGTPWKTPRSNRAWCPGRGGDCLAGKSSTRIATLWMRLRNSSGRESNASSATLTKSSRFILQPPKSAGDVENGVGALRVLVQYLNRLSCRQNHQLNTAPPCLLLHFVHYRTGTHACANDQLLTIPRYLFFE